MDFGTRVGLALLLLLAGSAAGMAQRLKMAITVDDLPAHSDLPPGMTRLDVAQSMLATLLQQKLPPTYGFVNADKVAGDPTIETVLQAWRDAGQPLGSHTYSHPNLDTVSAVDFEANALQNEPLLERYMPDQDWHWFRYPYLAEGDTLHKRRLVRAWLRRHHYKTAQVSMDFEDYLWNEPYARCAASHDQAAIQKLHDSYLATADQYIRFFRTITRMVYGRDIRYILLLHIGAFDARMLPDLLALYRSRGFRFISLAEASADPVYRRDANIGIKGGGAIQELMMARLNLDWPRNGKPYKQLEATCR
jgi:peptidoglycan/xylan/chitin deacetylase (PgdA/CDA1 family)